MSSIRISFMSQPNPQISHNYSFLQTEPFLVYYGIYVASDDGIDGVAATIFLTRSRLPSSSDFLSVVCLTTLQDSGVYGGSTRT